MRVRKTFTFDLARERDFPIEPVLSGKTFSICDFIWSEFPAFGDLVCVNI